MTKTNPEAVRAEELMIGNYIIGISTDDEDNEEKTICKVLGIDSVGFSEFKIWVDSKSKIEWFNDFQPIPLDEEWLRKFGFIKHESKPQNFYSKNWGENGSTIIVFDAYYQKYCYQFGPIYQKVLDWVHQLQNIYFLQSNTHLKLQDDGNTGE